MPSNMGIHNIIRLPYYAVDYIFRLHLTHILSHRIYTAYISKIAFYSENFLKDKRHAYLNIINPSGRNNYKQYESLRQRQNTRIPRAQVTCSLMNIYTYKQRAVLCKAV